MSAMHIDELVVADATGVWAVRSRRARWRSG